MMQASADDLAPIAIVLVGTALGGAIVAFLARRRIRRLSRALAHSDRTYEQLAEQAGVVVFRMGRDLSMMSASIHDLVGYTREEMRTIAFVELIHPDDLPCVVAAFHSLSVEHPRARLVYRLLHRDGAVVSVAGTFGRLDVPDGEFETTVTIRDITDSLKEAEAVRIASKAAIDAQAMADDANRAKSDFLASVSHEIRTPLNAILGFADLLLGSSDLPVGARRKVERIKGGGDALLMIVSDILDFSQAESGALQLDPRPFALPLLIDECIALVESPAIAKHLALRVELIDRFPTGLLGDEGRLRQILLNLLNNAIKFTPQGSVTVRIGYDRTSGVDRILFQVTDTGIGIASEDLPCLFQRFRQVDGTVRRTYGGTGLGLAISKMLVDLMDGSIGVSSTKGNGSTFWFSVVLPPASLVIATGASLPPVKRPRGLGILLVEDVPINQELARAILEAHGHVVDVVADGADAIMAVEDKAYDLVFMDVQMPYVDGFTATRAIRSLPSSASRVPIVAMTANVLREHVEAAYAAGMNDFIGKPVSIEALLAILDRVGQDALRQPVETRVIA